MPVEGCKMASLAFLLLSACGAALVSGQDQYLNPGDTFVSECPQNLEANTILRIFKDEETIPMFGSNIIIPRMFVTNNTHIIPSKRGGRIIVEVEPRRKIPVLTIKNVSYGDAGPYGCVKYKAGNALTVSMDRLIVKGPLNGVHWSGTGFKVLQDGAIDMLPLHGYFRFYCDLNMTNTAPEVYLTSGRYGEKGSTNLTVHENVYIRRFLSDGGKRSLYTLQTMVDLLVMVQRETILEGKPLYCRASLGSTTIEKSFRPVTAVLPGLMKCYPYMFQAHIGRKDLVLSCTIPVLYPSIEWKSPSGEIYNSSLQAPGYEMENKHLSESRIIETHLTIREVSEADIGQWLLLISNSYGKSNMTLSLRTGDPVSKSAISEASFLLVAVLSIFPQMFLHNLF